MVGADLVRGVVLVPVAIAGLAGHLPLWGLVVASFVLEAATSYFAPAYGATIPTLVDRENVQRRTRSSSRRRRRSRSAAGRSPRRSSTFMPVSVFFAVNAVLVLRLGGADRPHPARRASTIAHGEAPQLREGLAALRPRPMLAAGVVALGVAVTITAGTWIGGVPKLSATRCTTAPAASRS